MKIHSASAFAALLALAPLARADETSALSYLPASNTPYVLVAQAGPRTRVIAHGGIPVRDLDMPERPLAHPIKTFVVLNRGGERTVFGRDALPYYVLGAAVLASDRTTIKWFHPNRNDEKASQFSKTFSALAGPYVLGGGTLALLTLGHGREKDTGKLLVAAVGNAAFWTQVGKFMTGKERPNSSNNVPKYHGPGSQKRNSFPSGHTSAATSAAIILGHQYPRYKTLFYALAAGVGVARIEGHSHFPSDVYFGAGVGYYGARQALDHEDGVLRWRF